MPKKPGKSSGAKKGGKSSGVRQRAQSSDGVAKSRHIEVAEIHSAGLDEEDRILQKAAIYCLRTFPMLWTTGGIKKGDAPDTWIINIYCRYPTGFEGYIGDLLYDGKQFHHLTDDKTMRKRGRKIEADPALERDWKEYSAANFRTENG